MGMISASNFLRAWNVTAYFPDEPTLLGVNSAITALAQNAGSYERRVELEKAGAQALELGTDRSWKAIADLS